MNPNTNRIIFTPVYKAYNNLFKKALINNTSIKTDFEAFKDTGVYERYMLNAAQFSAAKSMAESKMLQSVVFNDKNEVRGFREFQREANQITDIFQDTWLRVEYDTAVKQAGNAELFTRMRADKDIYPYWVYLETDSTHPREEHLELVGSVFRIGDPEGDECFPPNGFNCGCGSDQVDDSYLEDNDKELADGKEALEHVDPQFRFNPADQGILPKESHSYFEVVQNANELNAGNFLTDDEKFQSIDRVMQQAKECEDQVNEVGEKYADEFDGTVTPVNFKSRDSIKRKLDGDLNGNIGDLKDAVRNTVVVNYNQLDDVEKALRQDPLFKKENGGRIKMQGGKSYFGYKGILTNYTADNGLVVEMQVNSPAMIYAKVPKAEALHIMSEEKYNEIAKASGLPGGLGHKYYEDIRVLNDKINKGKATGAEVQEVLKLIKQSREYYSKFYSL